jgi:hypothetical protein
MNHSTLISLFSLELFISLGCSCIGTRCGESTPMDQWEPMPQSYLADIDNPDADLHWAISAGLKDNSNPPELFQLSITLHSCGWNMLTGGAMSLSTPSSFDWTFSSPQPFFDLIDYIDQHPDVFFDYSEFSGTPPCEISLPQGTIEYFQLLVLGYGVEGHYYTIAKGTVEGGPPEIDYVISTIKTEFFNEMINHPSEEYQFPEEPLFTFNEDN